MYKIIVALITPFHKDKSIDETALRNLIRRLVKDGADGFVVCGTTAETPSLTKEEQHFLLEVVLDEVKHKPTLEVWVGCGTNNTMTTLQSCQRLEKYPITGVLLCTPYYNKPTQEGIYEHFSYIAKHTTCQIMLYNVPSRCGVEISYDTYDRLFHDYDNIVACKQASSDLETMQKLKQKFPCKQMYGGEDALLDESLRIGMDGMISVMAHVNLCEMKQFIEEDRKDRSLCERLKQQANLIFYETSPACVKYILSKYQEIENELRLPLVRASQQAMNVIDQSKLF